MKAAVFSVDQQRGLFFNNIIPHRNAKKKYLETDSNKISKSTGNEIYILQSEEFELKFQLYIDTCLNRGFAIKMFYKAPPIEISKRSKWRRVDITCKFQFF